MKSNVIKIAAAAVVGIGMLVATSDRGQSQQGMERAKAQCRDQYRAIAKKAGHDPAATIRPCVIAKMRAAGKTDEKSKAKFLNQCRAQYKSPAGVPNVKTYMQQCVRGKIGKGGKA